METKKAPTVLDPIIAALRTALAVQVDPKRSPWSQTHMAEFLDSMVYEAERAADKIRARDTRHEAMRAFVRDVADNWDCDADAHKYRTTCRSCAARALLDAEKNTPSASGTDGYLPDPCARCGKLDQLVEDLCHACRT